MLNRRGFLGSLLALGAAPAIVRADSLMRVVPRDLGIGAGWRTTTGGLLSLVQETEWALVQDILVVRSDIIDLTFGDRSPEICANIERNNALLRRLAFPSSRDLSGVIIAS